MNQGALAGDVARGKSTHNGSIASLVGA